MSGFMKVPGGLLDELRERLTRAEAQANEEVYEFRIGSYIPESVKVLRETLEKAEALARYHSDLNGQQWDAQWNDVQLTLLRIRACGWGSPR